MCHAYTIGLGHRWLLLVGVPAVPLLLCAWPSGRCWVSPGTSHRMGDLVLLAACPTETNAAWGRKTKNLVHFGQQSRIFLGLQQVNLPLKLVSSTAVY